MYAFVSLLEIQYNSKIVLIAKYQDFRDYAESCMSGSSGRQRVDVENLKNYPIFIPDESTIEKFNNEIETMVSKMHNNNKQIQTLIQTRDGLLPRLMSGEIKTVSPTEST